MYTPMIYILGNAHVFMTALEGVQAIFDPTAGVTAWAGGSGPFPVGALIKIALIVGLLFQSGKMMHTQQAEVKHIVVALMLYIALFVPVTNVDLYDLQNGTQYQVDNIPIGIAYSGGFVSTMSYDVMNTLSQVDNFGGSNISPLELAQDGFAGPLKNLLSIQRLPTVVKSSDPNLYYSMVSFAKDCNAGQQGFSVKNDIDNTDGTDSIFSKLTTTGQYNQDSYAYMFNAKHPWDDGSESGLFVTCADAANYINVALQNFFTSNTAVVSISNPGTTTSGSAGTLNGSLAKIESGGSEQYYSSSDPGDLSSNISSDISSLFPSCASSSTGNTLTCTASSVGLEFMENELEGCAAKEGLYSATTSSTQTDMLIGSLPAYCTTMTGALAHQEVSFAGMASSFLAFVGPLMTVLQFLFFALSPIVAVIFAFLGPAGPSYIGKYLMFGAWTQSFLPVAGVLNNLAQYDAISMFQKMLIPLAGAGTATNPALLTQFNSISSVFSYAGRSLSTVDMIMSFTPLVTAFLFTGSYFALTQLGSAIVGKEGLNKNQDLSTPNMGSTTFNTPVAGYSMFSSGSGQVAVNNAAIDSAPSLSVNSTIGAGVQAATTQAYSQLQSASSSIAAASSTAANLVNSNSITDTNLRNAVSTLSQTQTYQESLTTALEHGLNISHEKAKSMASEGTTKAGISVLGFILGEATKSASTRQQKEAITNATKLIDSQGESIAAASAFVQGYSASHADASSQVKSLARSLNETDNHVQQAADSFNTANSLQQTGSIAESSGAGINLAAKSAYAKMVSTYGEAGAKQRVGEMISHIRNHDPEAYMLAQRQMGGRTKSLGDKLASVFHAVQNLSATPGGQVAAAEAASYVLTKAGYTDQVPEQSAPAFNQADSAVRNGSTLGAAVTRNSGTPSTSRSSVMPFGGNPGLTPSQARTVGSQALQSVGYNPGAVKAQSQENNSLAAETPVGEKTNLSLEDSSYGPQNTLGPVYSPKAHGIQEMAANWARTHKGWVTAGSVASGAIDAGLDLYAIKHFGTDGWRQAAKNRLQGKEFNGKDPDTTSSPEPTKPMEGTQGELPLGDPFSNQGEFNLESPGQMVANQGSFLKSPSPLEDLLDGKEPPLGDLLDDVAE